MKLILKGILKLCGLFIRKFKVQGILFVAIIIALPISIGLFGEASTRYDYKADWELQNVAVNQVSDAYALRYGFDNYHLDESFKEKYTFCVTLQVKNVGTQENQINYDLGKVYFKDEDGYNIIAYREDYYYTIDQYDRPMCESIPSGKTAYINYYIVLDEDQVEEKLYICKELDEKSEKTLTLPSVSN